jgi:hypothetical protein
MIALINPNTKKPVYVSEVDVDGFLAVGFTKPVEVAPVEAERPKRGRPKKSE